MKLKNDEQRKQWLRNYKDWGVWYRDENIGATYYKYEFENGAQLIVDEYVIPKNGPAPEFVSGQYHLVGGPKPKDHKWGYHPVYHRVPDSMTELIEFLKFVGRDVDL